MMKGVQFSGNWLKFLAWPGLALMTAGLVVSGLSNLQAIAILLLMGGVILLLLGLSFSGKTAGAFWQQRSTQVGTNAVIAVVSMLVILGLVNFLAVQYSARLDLTETQLFTLAPASQQTTQALDQPVRVIIFDTVRNPRDVQLLESYARQSDQFSFEYIDPFANPIEAQAFGVNQAGMVFLEVDEERRFLQSLTDPNSFPGLAPPEPLSERQLTNALDQIVSDRSLTVYFVQGHGEYVIEDPQAGIQQAITGLGDKSYVVNPLNLSETQEVPEDANVVVVAGPSQDFFAAEVEALRSYLDEGGGLFLLLDPRSDAGLNRLLDDWGILLDDRIVLDTSGAGQFVGLGPAAPIVSNYGDHPITREFGAERSFFPIARPLEIEAPSDVLSTPLLLTDAQSRAEAISDEGDLTFDPEAPGDGPYVLGVALSRPVDGGDAPVDDEAPASETDASPPEEAPLEETTDSESRLVIIGNSTFATDGAFDQLLNGDIFLNAVSWLGQGSDATLSIRPKTVTNRQIQMTGQQALGLGVFAILVLPVSGVAMAILMAWRRR
ncbi:MAG: Gldg family protein [Cyanobacteria bacterium J06638_28]